VRLKPYGAPVSHRVVISLSTAVIKELPATSGWLVATLAKNVPSPRPPVGGIDEYIAQPGECGTVGDQSGEARLGTVSGIETQRQ
jgi:hypothetical protein